MTVYHLPTGSEVLLPACPLALALGNFDGVHLGHRRLLSETLDAAARIPGSEAAVWTFRTLAKEHGDVLTLTPQAEKLRQFAALGIRYAIFEDFSAVRTISAESFAREYLSRLGVAAVTCGFNFRFGHGGKGDASLLARVLRERGVPLTVVSPVTDGGEVISSTRIRRALLAGDCETAAALLGRPFSLELPVLHGKELGRTIGIPTVNQTPPASLLVPQSGIYVTVAEIGESAYPAVTNIGVRPTVETAGNVNCETHILDYDGILYGENVRISFRTRLRDEMRFSSLHALRAQLEADICRARAYFAAHPLRGKESAHEKTATHR